MTRIDSVLALTDFSAPARHAAERAAMVARDTAAALDLLHVQVPGALDRLRAAFTGLPANFEQTLVDEARRELHELATRVQARHAITPGTHLASGPLLAELIAFADVRNPDLLVLGARGSSHLRHRLLGSTAERMVRTTRRPLLVVKGMAHEPYRRVLVAVDFSAHSRPAIALARAIAPGATLLLLHAFEVPFEGKLIQAGIDTAEIEHYRQLTSQQHRARLVDLAREVGLDDADWLPRVLVGAPRHNILEQEQEGDCDLIVVGKHGESTLEDLILGCVTKQVLTEAQADVLVAV
ncbi:MAG: universal stress protein [Thauera sp.]|jgi:nucleotide-binding universal stress UspA family protein|nr:universal stress protein [Thauera sp.]